MEAVKYMREKSEKCDKYLSILRTDPNFEKALELRATEVAEQMASANNLPIKVFLRLARLKVQSDYDWVRGQYCNWMFGKKPSEANGEDDGKNSVIARLKAYGSY